MFNRILSNNYKSVLAIVSSVVYLAIFLTGIGRFRTVLAISIYFLLVALFELKHKDKRFLTAVLIQVAIVTLFFDAKYGQLLPLSEEVNYWLLGITLLFADPAVRLIMSKILHAGAPNALFIICPKCRRDNTILTRECSYCGYGSSRPVTVGELRITSIPGELQKEIESYRKMGLHQQLSKKRMQMLSLDEDEFLLIVKKIIGRPVYKNSSDLRMTFFIVTTKRVIFINYGMLTTTWTRREDIYLNSVVSVRIERQWHYMSEAPVIIIRNQNADEYILVFFQIVRMDKPIYSIMSCIRRRAAIKKITELPEDTRSNH